VRSAEGRSDRWGDLRTRVISASVMIPVAVACIWIGGVLFAVLVAAVSVGMAYEWLRLCQAEPGPRSILMFASLPLAVAIAALDHPGYAVGLLAMVTIAANLRRPKAVDPMALVLGVPYLGLAAVALTWLRLGNENGRAVVFVLLLVIWAGDIGAYAIGRVIGGPRLAPRISPGKTWSGAIGGLAASVCVGAIAAVVLGIWQPVWLAALLAGLLGVVGQAGDLLESALKRHFRVKDSGGLIPGHGGLLDRVDAVLTAAPVAAALALALGGGVILW
jgi:phosphatidate cytidylyltransferase